MATLTPNGYPTLVDVAKRLDPDGSIAKIAEMLNEDMDWLSDIPWVEGNLATGHRLTDRTALPSMSNAWRTFNRGVPKAKSRAGQFDEVCGMLETYSNVDVDLAALNGNTAAFRLSEAKPILESMGQEIARSVFYESVLNSPEKIHGLAARYAATSGYTSSPYVMKGDNSGVNCHSIWLLTWSPDYLFGIFPKASKAGLSQEDMGKQLVTDDAGGTFTALVEKFQWKAGIAVKDYRYAVRLQWDPDDAAFADDKKGMYLALQRMLHTIKKVSPQSRFYMNRTSRAKLGAQLVSNAANFITESKEPGTFVERFLGVPIRLVDTLVPESAIA